MRKQKALVRACPSDSLDRRALLSHTGEWRLGVISIRGTMAPDLKMRS
jgi:hypothetical protein